MLKEIRLIGSLMYGRNGARADFDVAIEVLRQNREGAAALITHRVPLRKIGDGFRIAADKEEKSIKVTIEP
jgi:threonine dehydrogenase-like Zn-dependent dehydrogenase